MGGNYKLSASRDYGLFKLSHANRAPDITKRRDLRHSMETHGFIPAYPIHCVRDKGKLDIRDGQHRFLLAKELKLPVFYVVCDCEAAIAELNNTQRRWTATNYAESYAAQNRTDYVELLEFVKLHVMPISTAAQMLYGSSDYRNLTTEFHDGSFRIRDRAFADRVARLYTQIGAVNSSLKTRSFAAALYAVCRAEGVDDARLIAGAKRVPEALKKYGTRDGYLSMLEQIYNHGRQIRFPLKIAAENALNARNFAKNGAKHGKE